MFGGTGKNQGRGSTVEWAGFSGWVGGAPEGRGLLVQEGLRAGGPVDELLCLEPKIDLRLGVIQGVAAVDDVPEDTVGSRSVTYSFIIWSILSGNIKFLPKKNKLFPPFC